MIGEYFKRMIKDSKNSKHFKCLRGHANKKFLLILLSLLVLNGTKGFGQSELTRLINYALEHSKEVKKSNWDIEQAKYSRKEVIGQGLPQIEGKAGYSKMFLNIDLPSSMLSNSAGEPVFTGLLSQLGNINALYSASLGVQATQLIYSQSYWEGLDYAKDAGALFNSEDKNRRRSN